MRATEA